TYRAAKRRIVRNAMPVSHAYAKQVSQPVPDCVRSTASCPADRTATLAEAVPLFRGRRRTRRGRKQKEARSPTREGEPRVTSHSRSWRGGLLGRQCGWQRALCAQRRDVLENQRWQRRPRIRAHGKIEGAGPRRASAPLIRRMKCLERFPQFLVQPRKTTY